MKSTDVEIYVEVRRQTEKAMLCWDGANEFWIPKSQVETEHVKGKDHKLVLPEWLAKEKGVI